MQNLGTIGTYKISTVQTISNFVDIWVMRIPMKENERSRPYC